MTVEIEIINWATLNPRADRNNFSWFRFYNRFFQSLFGKSDREKLGYIFMLCEASKKGRALFGLDVPFACAMLGWKEKDVLECIDALDAAGLTASSRRNGAVEPACGSPRGEERRGEENILSDKSDQNDFELLYKEYPKRKGDQGKKKALAKFRNLSPAKRSELATAVKNYRAFCDREGRTGTEYVKQLVTFMGGAWEEWVATATDAPAPREKTIEDYL